MFRERIKLVFALILICKNFLHPVISLRCRTDDGPSEADLKRVIRTCMRKFGENVTAADLNMQHLQQQQQQHYMNRAYSDNRFNGAFGPPVSGYSHNFNDYQNYYDDDDDANYYTQYYNNNNNQQQQFQNQYRSGQSNQQRNFDYIYNDNYNNNNNNKYNKDNNNNNNNNNSHGRQSTNYSNNQSNRSRDNLHNNNNNNNNNGNNHNIQNHDKENRKTTEGFCLVHCFFEQMHMVNERHYPDRRKVLFVLTQGIRNTELRNFYTDTIQECFRYVETQRQRGDKCQFARDLINCMAEYAKGNCDDWNEFNMMFN